MRHGVKKTKFRSGRDANRMLMRKLALNFLAHGKLTTTITKAKVLKTYMEQLTEKAKERKESNKNYLLRRLANVSVVNRMFDEVGPSVKEVTGGYVRIVKLGERDSDGALMARVQWTKPVLAITQEVAKPEVKEEAPAKAEVKPKKAAAKK